MKKTSGEIVASQIAHIPNTDRGYGYITIETPTKEYVKLKVDAMTKYETIERGQHVTIEFGKLGNTNILSAKRIFRKKV